MNVNNYNEWAQSVRLVLDNKGKFGFLTGAVAGLATGDPRYKQWKSENSLIIVWLVSSMKIGIEIRRKKARQGIMMGKAPQNSESEGSTLATRNFDEGRRSDKVPWCDHYKRE
ncbi:hypothetical protein KIW84_076091 [Lathyrus oleraceus]|uniref:Retrotransposon Copia-like N-terminal domain-containing protein n=1 Tax=Pisum sativum TaxID=3888 RepID=A0A9D4VVE5_PEA|nr:hypothetical protein KIW84_076091 [Pisum sativum]